MSRWRRALLAAALAGTATAGAATGGHPGIGRAPTADEIQAWNIDVRADFTGLPKGSGSVEQGQAIWDDRCASCHGTFGESNAVFTPLVGGTTADDIKTGRAKTLASSAPVRTTFSVLPTIATLWDYIHRAMPWNAPKSLSNDQVYAVLAYLLNLADIVPSGFVLNEQTIREVQGRLPNRNGMVRFEGLWDRHGAPDTHNVACMHDCVAAVTVTSTLPEFARNSHGNLALQNRSWTAVRGANTEVPSGSPQVRMVASVAPAASSGAAAAASPLRLAERSGCLGCHGVASRIVGPGFDQVATRYKGDADAAARLLQKIRSGGSGTWGSVPMPAQTAPSDDELKALVAWILAGAKAPP